MAWTALKRFRWSLFPGLTLGGNRYIRFRHILLKPTITARHTTQSFQAAISQNKITFNIQVVPNIDSQTCWTSICRNGDDTSFPLAALLWRHRVRDVTPFASWRQQEGYWKNLLGGPLSPPRPLPQPRSLVWNTAHVVVWPGWGQFWAG